MRVKRGWIVASSQRENQAAPPVATSREVARLAGVSQPTVSRALSQSPGVSAATRERVLQAAQALNYVPHEGGRSLVTRRSRRVGVVAAQLGNPYYPALVEPMHRTLREGGYRTILFTDGGGSPLDIDNLLDGSLDGVIITTSEISSRLPFQLHQRGVPYVLVNRTIDETPGGDSCVADNYLGGELVAAMFVELEHTRIGAIFGPKNTSTGRDRESGFRDELSEQGVPLRRQFLIRGSFSYETGYHGIVELFRAKNMPTAIFCANDAIALGALNAAHVLNIQVPQELTIVGFDDIPMAGWPIFGLTTVGTDLTGMAEVGAKLVMERIRDPQLLPRPVVIEPTLVRRGSHSSPKTPD
jgi:LacI family transcriptional regulator